MTANSETNFPTRESFEDRLHKHLPEMVELNQILP